jgi:hypothetical protein
MAEKTCKHPTCTCPIPEYEDYCSQICKDAQGLIELICECGHDSCVSEEIVEAAQS